MTKVIFRDAEPHQMGDLDLIELARAHMDSEGIVPLDVLAQFDQRGLDVTPFS